MNRKPDPPPPLPPRLPPEREAAKQLIYRARNHLRRAEGWARKGEWLKMRRAIQESDDALEHAIEVAEEAAICSREAKIAEAGG